MPDPISMVMGNLFKSGNPIFIGVAFLFMAAFGGVGSWLLYDWVKWRPKEYDAVIFESIGSSLRPYFTKILYKFKPSDKGYYLKGSKELLGGINLTNAFPGKTSPMFLLRKLMVNNREVYVPMKVNDKIKLKYLDEKGKYLDKDVTVEEFATEAKLDDLDVAVVESVKRDNLKFKWTNTMQQVLQFAAPMIVILLAFLIVGWASKNNTSAVIEIGKATAEMAKQSAAMDIIAKGVSDLVQHVGAAVMPPPG